MTTNRPAAYGLYPRDVALQEIVHTLNDAGFGKEDICVMLSPTHPIATVVREASIFNADREATATTAGLIGWLSEIRSCFDANDRFFHPVSGILPRIVGCEAISRSVRKLGITRSSRFP